MDSSESESAAVLPAAPAHVPFLQSVIASGGPAASWGNAVPDWHYFGGSGGSGVLGGFGGGFAPGTEDPSLETGSGDGDHRVSLLGHGSGEGNDNGNNGWNGGGFNGGGFNGGGSNGGGSKGRGSHDGESQDGGWNDHENGGSGNGDSNDGGQGGGSNNNPNSFVAKHADDESGPDTKHESDPKDEEHPETLQVPEPSLLLLSGLGIAGLLVRRARRA